MTERDRRVQDSGEQRAFFSAINKPREVGKTQEKKNSGSRSRSEWSACIATSRKPPKMPKTAKTQSLLFRLVTMKARRSERGAFYPAPRPISRDHGRTIDRARREKKKRLSGPRSPADARPVTNVRDGSREAIERAGNSTVQETARRPAGSNRPENRVERRVRRAAYRDVRSRSPPLPALADDNPAVKRELREFWYLPSQ